MEIIGIKGGRRGVTIYYLHDDFLCAPTHHIHIGKKVLKN